MNSEIKEWLVEIGGALVVLAFFLSYCFYIANKAVEN